MAHHDALSDGYIKVKKRLAKCTVEQRCGAALYTCTTSETLLAVCPFCYPHPSPASFGLVRSTVSRMSLTPRSEAFAIMRSNPLCLLKADLRHTNMLRQRFKVSPPHSFSAIWQRVECHV